MATDTVQQTTPPPQPPTSTQYVTTPTVGGSQGLSRSSLLLCVFGVCGLAFGSLGDSVDSIALYTMVGAAVGLTLGFCAQALMD